MANKLINSAQLRLYILKRCEYKRPGAFRRVRGDLWKDYLWKLERMIDDDIDGHPSRGVTFTESRSCLVNANQGLLS